MYTAKGDPVRFTERVRLSTIPTFLPSHAIKTTGKSLIVRSGTDGNREAAIVQWGLVPSWANDPKAMQPMVNARGETIADKPSFRTAYKKRRCLVAADGFYEARSSGKTKEYFYIHMADNAYYAFAGLWERWEREGQSLETCTIITSEPNSLMAKIHDRMPVIVQPNEYDAWLDPEVQPGPLLDSIIAPRDYAGQVVYQVSNKAWTKTGDTPDALLPLHPSKKQT